MSYHVRITRISDTSADTQLGHPPKTGTGRYSRTFPNRAAAERERDAWNQTGEFAHITAQIGPSDFSAEVVDGPAPRETARPLR